MRFLIGVVVVVALGAQKPQYETCYLMEQHVQDAAFVCIYRCVSPPTKEIRTSPYACDVSIKRPVPQN